MNDFYIPATSMSPEIDFRFSSHELNIKGESYPENAAAFYGQVLSRLEEYLISPGHKKIEVNVELKYFNSSSTKILLKLFEMLNDTVAIGNDVMLNWYHDEDDDTILEFGEDLHSDYGLLNFNPIAISEA